MEKQLTRNIKVKDENGKTIDWDGSYWHIRGQTVVRLIDGSFYTVGGIHMSGGERYVEIEKNLGKVEFNSLHTLLA